MRKNSIVALPVALMAVAYSSTAYAASDKQCETYANLTMNQVKMNGSKGCRLKDPAGRWSTRYIHHYNWCKGLQPADEHYIVSEGDARHGQLEDCIAEKAAAGGGDDGGDGGGDGGGKTAAAATPTDIYDEPGGTGQRIGTLNPGDGDKPITCREDQWCQIPEGWVWGGDMAL